MKKRLILNNQELKNLHYILTDWIDKQELFFDKAATESIKELIERAKEMKREIGSELK